MLYARHLILKINWAIKDYDSLKLIIWKPLSFELNFTLIGSNHWEINIGRERESLKERKCILLNSNSKVGTLKPKTHKLISKWNSFPKQIKFDLNQLDQVPRLISRSISSSKLLKELQDSNLNSKKKEI